MLYAIDKAHLTNCTKDADGSANPGGSSSPGAGAVVAWDVAEEGDVTLAFDLLNPGTAPRSEDIRVAGKSIGSVTAAPGKSTVTHAATLPKGGTSVALVAGATGGANVYSLAVTAAIATAAVFAASAITAASVGPDKGITLKIVAGGPTINKDGQVLENVHVNGGDIDVELPAGAKAYIRNISFDGGYRGGSSGDYYAITATKNKGTIYIDKSELAYLRADGLIGSGIVITNSHIHHAAGDGLKPQHNCTVQECMIEELGYASPDAHADGLQLIGTSNVKVLGNKIRSIAGDGFKGNTCIQLQGRCDDTVIDGNDMECTNTGIHAYPEGGKLAVTNNHIVAKTRLSLEAGANVTQSGNT